MHEGANSKNCRKSPFRGEDIYVRHVIPRGFSANHMRLVTQFGRYDPTTGVPKVTKRRRY